MPRKTLTQKVRELEAQMEEKDAQIKELEVRLDELRRSIASLVSNPIRIIQTPQKRSQPLIDLTPRIGPNICEAPLDPYKTPMSRMSNFELGTRCACSPPGQYHDEDCKGWNPADLTDMNDQPLLDSGLGG